MQAKLVTNTGVGWCNLAGSQQPEVSKVEFIAPSQICTATPTNAPPMLYKSTEIY